MRKKGKNRFYFEKLSWIGAIKLKRPNQIYGCAFPFFKETNRVCSTLKSTIEIRLQVVKCYAAKKICKVLSCPANTNFFIIHAVFYPRNL